MNILWQFIGKLYKVVVKEANHDKFYDKAKEIGAVVPYPKRVIITMTRVIFFAIIINIFSENRDLNDIAYQCDRVNEEWKSHSP